MDFRQTFQSTNRNEVPAAPAAVNSGQVGKKDNSGRPKNALWLSILSMIVLVGVVLLVIATAVALLGNKPANEQKYIDSNAYQAVFLNNGQVYFGKMQSINSRFVNMTGVYYLTQSTASTANTTTAASSDYTLVKLGCQQIHYPKDQMIVTRDQVTFWENLSKDGKVAKSIGEFIKQNPKGENCSTTSSQTQSSTDSTQATQSSTNGTGTTTTKTTTGN